MQPDNVFDESALAFTLETIGNKLTELRKQKGYTSHAEFAYDNNLPRIQYWRMEKGLANITLKSLHRVLTIHSLTIEEFFHILHKQKSEASQPDKD